MITPSQRHEHFAAVIEPELPLLLRVARSLTPSTQDAEDLVQDTVIRAYRNLDRFDDRHPRAWLLTILRNANINRARKKRPDLFAEPDAVVERTTLLVSPEQPERTVVEAMFDATVADALDALPPDFMAVVRAVDLEGCSYAEAAKRLGIPVGTVMSRLHRARARLRSAIETAKIEELLDQ